MQKTLLLTIVCLGVNLLAAPREVCAQTSPSFNRDIRPLLAAKCFACHGPDEAHREADLRLDVREVAIDTGAIVPGNIDKSEIVRRIFSNDPDEQMPPKGKRLTAEEVSRLQRWLDQGASWPDALAGRDKNLDHWAFQAIQRPPLPAGSSPATPRMTSPLGLAAPLRDRKSPSPRSASPLRPRTIGFSYSTAAT